MKFKWKQPIRTIRTRVFLVFFCIMTVNLLFSAVLYTAATSSIREKLLEQMEAQAEFYLETIDSNFRNVRQMLDNMFLDRKLVFLVDDIDFLNDYELRDAYLSEQDRIMMIRENNALISSAMICLPNTRMKISDTEIKEITEEEYEKLEQAYLSLDSLPVYQDGRLLMTSTGISGYRGESLPDVLFMVEFSEKQLRNTLRSFNTEKGGGSFLYEEQQEFFLDSSPDNAVGEQILNELKPILEQQETFSGSVRANGEKYQVVVSRSQYIGWFVQYLPEREVLKSLSSYKWFPVFYLLISAAAILGFAKHIERTIHKPLSGLMKAFASVEKENIGRGGTQYVGEDEFSYLFAGFNQMQDKTKQLIEELIWQKALTQEAELKQLQAQINPHFLYNSFYSLKAKIHREDLEGAEQLASLLGRYFRFLTRNGEMEVLLKNEVEHARSYAEIQQMRFYDRMSLQFAALPEKYEQIPVPRLILQPIIENALKYALEEKEEGSVLKVGFYLRDAQGKCVLEIRVEDNGELLDEQRLQEMNDRLLYAKETTGIVNIHRRLLLRFGAESGLEIGRSELGGACIAIRIPLGQEKE